MTIAAAQHERAKYAGIYAAGGRYAGYGHSHHGKHALPIVQKWAATSLLDVGCGHNEFCQALAAVLPDAKLTGVDFACPGADVIADATALPFEDKAYDVLTAFDMLEHVLPEQVDAILAEFARVSRRFIFSISYVASVIKWEGENLHPTVQPETWWIQRIMRAGGCSIEKRGRYLTGEWQPALRLDPDAKVVLVGNGPSLAGAGRGAEIDEFQEIVRFNTFHIAGHEKDTGTRTTLWSTFGRGALPHDPEQRPDRIIYLHGEKGDPAYAPREIYRIPRLQYNETRAHLQRRAWWWSGFTANTEPLLATSGLQVAAWLLQVVGVKQITLGGFDHFNVGKSAPHHYWHHHNFGKPKEHDGAVEAAIFSELKNSGRVAYL